MLQSFDDYRDRMLSIMAGVEGSMTIEPPADSDVLDLARARMARVMTAYHLFADRELFGPCAALAAPAQRLRVKAVAADCARLAVDFRAFTRDCAATPVLPRWGDYRLQATAMMNRIRKHLQEAEIEARHCASVGIFRGSGEPVPSRVIAPTVPARSPAGMPRRVALG